MMLLLWTRHTNAENKNKSIKIRLRLLEWIVREPTFKGDILWREFVCHGFMGLWEVWPTVIHFEHKKNNVDLVGPPQTSRSTVLP